MVTWNWNRWKQKALKRQRISFSTESSATNAVPDHKSDFKRERERKKNKRLWAECPEPLRFQVSGSKRTMTRRLIQNTTKQGDLSSHVRLRYFEGYTKKSSRVTLDASRHLVLISPSLFSPSLLWVTPDVRGADQNRRDAGRIQGESLSLTKRVRWVAKLLFSSVSWTSLTTVAITQRINYINDTNKVWLHPRLGPPPRKKLNFFVTTFSWIKSECDMSFLPPITMFTFLASPTIKFLLLLLRFLLHVDLVWVP